MTTHALNHYPSRSELPRWLLTGFISGALAVLILHQGTLGLLHVLGMLPNPPYSMTPTRPFGVPVVWSLTFWGGVWGAVLAASLGRLDGARLIVGAIIFGAIFPTLVAWFVVAPMKGQPMAGGFIPSRMMIGPLVNGAWGLGAGIGLALFGRRHNSH